MNKQHIHFIGIGGIGMSSLALIAAQQGHAVSGCDRSLHQSLRTMLEQAGCLLNTEHCLLHTVTIVVYSSAINHTHPELQHAYAKVALVLHRSELLAMLIKDTKSIAVSGSHGKTTTTALIAHVLDKVGYSPGFSIGGIPQNFTTHGRAAHQDWFVLEADESDRSLLNLSPTIALITNIDYEHAETYTDLADLQAVFEQFIQKVPAEGLIVGCIESQTIVALLKNKIGQSITYGFKSIATIQAYNIEHNLLASSAHIVDNRTQTYLGILRSPLRGTHNILNAVGALALCLHIGISFEQFSQALSSFRGVERRFEYKGTLNNAVVYEDYGHHPEEIKYTLSVACAQAAVNLVFQPHRYTRTKALWKDFITVLQHAPLKSCIITDIYSAGELPINAITAQQMVYDLQQLHTNYPVFYVTSDQNYLLVYDKILTLIESHDIVLLQGAGPLYNILDHRNS